MFHGSCLCGAVKYTILLEQLDDITLCHCHKCQKASGSAFNAVTPVAAEFMQIQDEQNMLKHFESSPGVERNFCGQCGSPVFSFRPALQQYRVRIGSLDDNVNANQPNTFTTPTEPRGSSSMTSPRNTQKAFKSSFYSYPPSGLQAA